MIGYEIGIMLREEEKSLIGVEVVKDGSMLLVEKMVLNLVKYLSRKTEYYLVLKLVLNLVRTIKIKLALKLVYCLEMKIEHYLMT